LPFASWDLAPKFDSPRLRIRALRGKALALWFVTIIAMRIAFLLALTLSTFAQEKPYRSYLTGNPADAHTQTTFGIAMLGGGGDVDEAYQWLCERSGGGDFVVLRASGEDGYNDYLYKLCKLDSVESIVTLSREAGSDPYVLQQVRNAEAIFFAGGDQANYVRFWKGTPLNNEINKAIARGVPVGGVSAGLAILGEYSFSAMYTDETNKDRDSSITSEEALANPYDPKLTLERDFIKIPLLKGVITDSHFTQRKREGRLLAFMARLKKDGWEEAPRGVGIDEVTAMGVDRNGDTTVFGKGSIRMIQFGTVKQCARRKLSLEAYGDRFKSSQSFNLPNWSPPSVGIDSYSVKRGHLVTGTIN
jgi:cyanophycinase